MSVFRDLMYLEHIQESIQKIQLYTSGMTEEDFQNSSLVQDAVIRQFEIIGEATKQISDSLKSSYASVPWKDMAGMRDILIHDYINVETDVVWKTVQDHLPSLKNQIIGIIKDLNS
ncbi:MAG: DUF86 domain-containing protein [Bacteroidetes bacterium]|nr:DUF86 domain-containing protein [Bacteroidota bacterium]